MSNYFMNYHMVLVLNEKMMKGTVTHIYFAVFSSERSFPTFSLSFIMCDVWESLRGMWSGTKESGNKGKNRELLWSKSPQGNVYQRSCHPLYCIALWLCTRPSNIGSLHLTYWAYSSHTDTWNFCQDHFHSASSSLRGTSWDVFLCTSGVFASRFGWYVLHLWQWSPQVLSYRCSFAHVLFPKHDFN